MTYAGAYSETRQYNANNQLIRETATPTAGGQGIDISYNFPSANNGRVQSITDHVTGEQVTYTYDQLNRLIQAVSTASGTMNYAYDGFGNLTQNGSTTLSIDATTNRINSTGYTYNANGNLTASPGTTYSYDVANRLVSNNAAYDPGNRRIIDGNGYLYLYGEAGELLAKYQPVWSVTSQALIQGSPRLSFAGRMLADTTQGWTMTDRLGSVRLNQNGERSNYQAYGTETTSTSQNRAKFATYWRDSGDLDYAEQTVLFQWHRKVSNPRPEHRCEPHQSRQLEQVRLRRG